MCVKIFCLENPLRFGDHGLGKKSKARDKRQIFTVIPLRHPRTRFSLKMKEQLVIFPQLCAIPSTMKLSLKIANI